MQTTELSENRVALITGAAHRIGAEVATTLHNAGFNLVLHYRHSHDAADALRTQLEAKRQDSVALLQGDLLDMSMYALIVTQAAKRWGRLNILINNASSFYETTLGNITEQHWDDLIGTNLKAPLFLSQAAAPYLKAQKGCIVNIVDIHAKSPLKDYPVYSIAKAGLVMLTKTLAREMGPDVRVNAVAPGAILWPENDMEDSTKNHIISRTALKRIGHPSDIAKAVLFLIKDAQYISGQVLAVDGGRTLNI